MKKNKIEKIVSKQIKTCDFPFCKTENFPFKQNNKKPIQQERSMAILVRFDVAPNWFQATIINFR